MQRGLVERRWRRRFAPVLVEAIEVRLIDEAPVLLEQDGVDVPVRVAPEGGGQKVEPGPVHPCGRGIDRYPVGPRPGGLGTVIPGRQRAPSRTATAQHRGEQHRRPDSPGNEHRSPIRSPPGARWRGAAGTLRVVQFGVGPASRSRARDSGCTPIR